MEDRREYTVRCVVEFHVDVSAEDPETAREEAERRLLDALAPWDMPDSNIIDIENGRELL